MFMQNKKRIFISQWDTLKLKIDCGLFLSKKCSFKEGCLNYLEKMHYLQIYKWEILIFQMLAKWINKFLILKLNFIYKVSLMESINTQKMLKCYHFNFIYYGFNGKIGKFKILFLCLHFFHSLYNLIGFIKLRDKDCYKQ